MFYAPLEHTLKIVEQKLFRVIISRGNHIIFTIKLTFNLIDIQCPSANHMFLNLHLSVTTEIMKHGLDYIEKAEMTILSGWMERCLHGQTYMVTSLQTFVDNYFNPDRTRIKFYGRSVF